MSKLNIGVFGDSYADRHTDPILAEHKTDESWLAYIESKNHKITSYGLGGSATWYSVQKFKKLYKQFDHIVFCWSHLNRIHTMPNKFARLAGVSDVDRFYSTGLYRFFSGKEQARIVQMILGHNQLCNLEFNQWAQQKMFDDVNDMCREGNIKLVNILPFVLNVNQIDFSNRAGDCLFRLYDVSEKELDWIAAGSRSFSDVRSTHLSKENNEILGQIILDKFIEGKKSIMDLFSQGNFIFCNKISDRYKQYGYYVTEQARSNNALYD